MGKQTVYFKVHCGIVNSNGILRKLLAIGFCAPAMLQDHDDCYFSSVDNSV